MTKVQGHHFTHQQATLLPSSNNNSGLNTMFLVTIVLVSIMSCLAPDSPSLLPTAALSQEQEVSDLLKGTQLHISDPKAPLTQTDIAKLLLNHSENRAKQKRDRTEYQISLVIEGSTKQIAGVIASTNKDNLANVEKIRGLELKLDTVTKYQEETFYSHRLEATRTLKKYTIFMKSNFS